MPRGTSLRDGGSDSLVLESVQNRIAATRPGRTVPPSESDAHSTENFSPSSGTWHGSEAHTRGSCPSRARGVLGCSWVWHQVGNPCRSSCFCPIVIHVTSGSRLFLGLPSPKTHPRKSATRPCFQGLRPPAGHTCPPVAAYPFLPLLSNSAILCSPVSAWQRPPTGPKGHLQGPRLTPKPLTVQT